jgi:hypothetical protein
VNRNRIVTPYTDPNRFTAEEKAYFDKGLCCWDVGVQYFGQIDNLCGERSETDAPFGYCTNHKLRLLEDHWPDGSPRR